MISDIVLFACSLVHNFLRKLRSHEICNPCFFASLQASNVIWATCGFNAGVIPVKWNQSASKKISFQSKSVGEASEIEEPARS